MRGLAKNKWFNGLSACEKTDIAKCDVKNLKNALSNIDWVIVGGESGPAARPITEEWVLDLQEQCRKADVSFFFRQWGGVNKKRTGRLLKGRVYNELPNLANAVLAA